MTFPLGKVLTVLLICGNVVTVTMMILMATKNHDLWSELIKQDKIIALHESEVSLQKRLIALKDESISRQDDKIDHLNTKIALLEQIIPMVEQQRHFLLETNALHEKRITGLEKDLAIARELIGLKGETIALLEDDLRKTIGVAGECMEALESCHEVTNMIWAEFSVCQAQE